MTKELFSRIAMLVLIGACVAASSDIGQTRPAASRGDETVYFGTYTNATSKGIYQARFDPRSGKLGTVTLAAVTDSPSFFAISQDGRFLYAVNELSQFQGKPSGAVSTFAVDAADGTLRLLNQIPSGGTAPAYISFDRSGKYLFVANYGTGSVDVFPRLADGSLGPATSVSQHQGSSVNPRRQRGPHAHFAFPSPDNRFVLSADLGLDQVLVSHFNASNGTLAPNAPPFAAITPGSGPRHLVFSADGTRVYLVSEMGSIVTAFAYDPAAGSLKEFQSLPTQPPGFKGTNGSGAEIALSPNGRYLYVSNRGSDTMAQFAVQLGSGRLSWVGAVSTQGKTPRMFQIDRTGKYLWVANQDSGNVVVFRINPKNGKLTPSGLQVPLARAVCIQFVGAR